MSDGSEDDADGRGADMTALFGEDGDGKPLKGLPFAEELGIRLHKAADGEALLSIPYDERLIGDPTSGVIHGGVVTSLLDTCAGVAVIHSPTQPKSTATLDLRIDYMRPATAGRTLYARAVCYRETRLITFVRGVAFHDDPDDPVANAIGAFMVDGRTIAPKEALAAGGEG